MIASYDARHLETSSTGRASAEALTGAQHALLAAEARAAELATACSALRAQADLERSEFATVMTRLGEEIGGLKVRVRAITSCTLVSVAHSGYVGHARQFHTGCTCS